MCAGYESAPPAAERLYGLLFFIIIYSVLIEVASKLHLLFLRGAIQA